MSAHVCIHVSDGLCYPERAVPISLRPIKIGGKSLMVDQVYNKESCNAPSIVSKEGKVLTIGDVRIFDSRPGEAMDVNMDAFKAISRCTYMTRQGHKVIVADVPPHDGIPNTVSTSLPTFPFIEQCKSCGSLIPFSENMGAGYEYESGRVCETCAKLLGVDTDDL